MTKLLFGILLGIGLAYFLYIPLPDGVTQPTRMRAYAALGQVCDLYVSCAQAFGYLQDTTSSFNAGWKIRQWVTDLGIPDEPTVKHSHTKFDGVGVRLYEPVKKSSKLLPGIVYIHGGGWVAGNVDIYHTTTRHMAAKLGIVLASVDYRMAPEYPFPVPLQDCLKATVWFLQHAEEYGVDPSRIAVVGDSAGGNLAAAVSLALTNNDEYKRMALPALKFQGLVYPALQAVDFLLPSYQQYDITIDIEIMTIFWALYMNGKMDYIEAMQVNNHTSPQYKKSDQYQKLLDHGRIPEEYKKVNYQPPKSQDFGDDRIFSEMRDTILDPLFAPLMQSDLRGLPPAYMITAGLDVLRDEALIYAQRLEEDKVPVTLKHYDDGYHGMFMSFGSFGYEVGDRCMDDFIQYSKITL